MAVSLEVLRPDEARPELTLVEESDTPAIVGDGLLGVQNYSLGNKHERVDDICTIQDGSVTLSDGTDYEFRIYHPNGSTTREETVTSFPAWFTNIDDCVNRQTGIRLAQRGMLTIAVSAEQINPLNLLPINPVKAVKSWLHLREVSLQHDVNAHGLILDKVGEDRSIKTDRVIGVGHSRGNMELLGLFAAGRLLYLDGRDPSGEHDVTWAEIHRMFSAGNLATEALEIMKVATEMTPRDFWHTTSNIPKTLQAIPGHLAYTPTLARNDAGDFIANVPTNAAAYLEFYKGSAFAHTEGYIGRLASFRNVCCEIIDGKVHISGALSERLGAAVDRIERMQDSLRTYEPKDIDPATQVARRRAKPKPYM